MLNFEIGFDSEFELAAPLSSAVATAFGCHIKDKPSPEERSSTVPYSLVTAPYDSTPY